MTSYKNNRPLQKIAGWGERSSSYSHWTTTFSDQWYLVSLFILAAFHLVLSGLLPPTEDELYYWTWAKNLQLSYYDHPPLVALLIRISISIFGDNIFGIRFFATGFQFIIFFLVGSITPGKKVLGLVLLTPVVLFGSVLMTPDVPFLLFWTLYLFWLVSINKSFSQWGDDPVSRVYRPSPIYWEQWLWGGILLGLGLLSKYTMVLAIPCSLFVLWTKYRLRSWFRGFVGHLFIALVVSLPILIFNWRYQFAPLQFQWSHSLAQGTGVFTDFLGSQILLLGSLPFLMLGWVLLLRKDLCSNSDYQVCFYFFVLPILFSLFQAAKTHVEANWAFMSYVAFWPMAQFLLNRNSIKLLDYLLLGLGFIPPLVVSVLLAIHLVYPLKWVTPEKDRIGKQAALYELTKTIQADLEANDKKEMLFLPTYQLTSYFKFLGLQSEQLFPLGRASNFTLEPKDPCRFNNVILLSESANPNYETLKCFSDKQILKEYSLELRGRTISQWYLIEYFRPL